MINTYQIKNKFSHVCLKMFFCIAIFCCSAPIFSQTDYEAETAKLSNGAEVQECPFCSGTRQVRNIGGERNGSVMFDNIFVKQAGLYSMTIYYVTGDDRSFTVTVNSEAIPREFIFFRTGNKGEVSTKSIPVPLKQGVNTIRFDNTGEGSAELDKISVSSEPLPSISISGKVTGGKKSSLAGTEIILSGEVNAKAITDAKGFYEFQYLPAGSYYVGPEKEGFLPYNRFISASSVSMKNQDFTTKKQDAKKDNESVMTYGSWKISYDLDAGTADFFHNNSLIIPGAYAAVRIPATLTTFGYKSRKVREQPLNDANGNGKLFTVELSNNDTDKMIQTFRIYDNFILTGVTVVRKSPVASNYMAPLISGTGAGFLSQGDNRVLFVPFDNDKWIRYQSYPFHSLVTSYEVSAFYNNDSRNGLVVGSVAHDTWKTGVKSYTHSNLVQSLEVFGGVSSTKTRDILPHGKVMGTAITSPLVFIGYFDDWREGMEWYARANAAVTPPRAWTNGTPFGWNSWGKIQGNLSYDKAVQVSDFFAKELQPRNFQNNGVVYVGLDSWWDKLSDEQLKLFVDHCIANGQEAGIYWAPFTQWGNDENATVQGSDYKYKDVYLYANGRKQYLDGGIAIDPTHPATKKRMEYFVNRFKKAGFKYLKIDFLTHGAFEADAHYDKNISTGMQAYNKGMRDLMNTVGDSMYLNQAISPLFPGCYAQSRRIACDSWGTSGQTEYTLNALTYGWWLTYVYRYNDADHVVLGDYSEGENRMRVTSSVITGIYILGDDFSNEGSPVGKDRAVRFVTNADINAIAKTGRSFRPLEGNTGYHATEVFVREDKDYFYLAVFNFGKESKEYTVDLSRAGLVLKHPVTVKELWSGKTMYSTGYVNENVAGTDVAVFRISRNE